MPSRGLIAAHSAGARRRRVGSAWTLLAVWLAVQAVLAAAPAWTVAASAISPVLAAYDEGGHGLSTAPGSESAQLLARPSGQRLRGRSTALSVSGAAPSVPDPTWQTICHRPAYPSRQLARQGTPSRDEPPH
jgi:hypothetical protein